MGNPTTVNGLSNSHNLPDSSFGNKLADNSLASVHSVISVVINDQGAFITNFDDTGNRAISPERRTANLPPVALIALDT